MTEQTDFKGQHSLILFYYGPCHLSSFKLCSGDLIFLWEQLFLFSYVKNKYISSCP